jgi:nucleotide-binding universal stress UspA family protein
MTAARIVVGVDDSASARRALAWAIDEAALLGVELDVVHAYQPPVVIVPPTMLTQPSTGRDAKERAQALVHRLASEALAQARRRPCVVETIAAEGTPGHLLAACVQPGDRLVVGSRASDRAALVLGSCSYYCVHHARCPVVVVPDR